MCIYIYIYVYMYIYVVLCVYAYKYTSQGYVDRSVRAIIKSTDNLSFWTPQTGETSTRGLSILESLDVRGMERSMEISTDFSPWTKSRRWSMAIKGCNPQGLGISWDFRPHQNHISTGWSKQLSSAWTASAVEISIFLGQDLPTTTESEARIRSTPLTQPLANISTITSQPQFSKINANAILQPLIFRYIYIYIYIHIYIYTHT